MRKLLKDIQKWDIIEYTNIRKWWIFNWDKEVRMREEAIILNTRVTENPYGFEDLFVIHTTVWDIIIEWGWETVIPEDIKFTAISTKI